MKKKRVKELINYLNKCTKAYDEGRPIISDKQWDDKYFELVELEKEIGFTYPNSPTQSISFEVVNKLEKVEHNHKMLSLDKTKSIEEVKAFARDIQIIAMDKMDGLTCSLMYKNGKLISAETRGNGLVGENILHNAKVNKTIPCEIPYTEDLIIDGEIICTYKDFELFSSEYKNPRNFAAGSIRLLDANESACRNLTFVAWDVIEGFNDIEHLETKLILLESIGFTVVPYYIFSSKNESEINDIINMLADEAIKYDYPIDGIVFKYNEVKYKEIMGETAHHFKNAIAFKFRDESYSTQLLDIEWSMGRTGVLTPIAIFETVEIDGTEVSRASLHNINTMTALLGPQPAVKQIVEVIKSNMIIPQIISSTVGPSDGKLIEIPSICPICGEKLHIIENNMTENLFCSNPNCEGKLINKLDHFCSKKGLDIKGLSIAILDKLISWGWINNLSDIMLLYNYRDEWIKKPGFGEKSVDKILKSIEESKNTTLDAFISSLGIPLIGRTVSKELVKCINSYEDFRNKAQNKFDFSTLEGFAESKTTSIWNYDFTEADKIYPYLTFKIEEKISDNKCQDIKVVITGKISYFKNRNELKAVIENNGGKVVDSISKNINYLINNDINSTSSKNQNAKKLNIPIVSEEEFLKKFNLI